MAGRPKKTNVENNVNNINKNTTNTDSTKVDSLIKENAELKAQLKSVLDKLSTIETKTHTSSSIETYSKDETITEYKDINPLKPIKVISLSDGGVSLRTNAAGNGKTFRFDKFGHSISIAYSDLQDIIATDRTFIEDGVVYICDTDVVKNNYLDDYYKKFLTIDKITNILSFSCNDISDMISGTTESIQETIISLIVKKINNGEYVDMNKVEVIGKNCVNPCDISALALEKRVK